MTRKNILEHKHKIQNKAKDLNFNIPIGLIEFSKQKKRKDTLSMDDLNNLGSGYMGLDMSQRLLRRGLPMTAGVRLESHSTSHANARKILNEGGILDPNRMGEKTGPLMGGFGSDSIYKGKKYSFITGSLSGLPIDRLRSQTLRKTYRVQSAMDPEDLAVLQRKRIYDNLKAYKAAATTPEIKEMKRQQLNNLFRTPNEYYALNLESFDDLDRYPNSTDVKMKTIITKESPKFKKISREMQLRSILPSLSGRSLYVGGSDAFYKDNFTPDEDMPRIAMKTDKPIRVHGSRTSATIAAIKREGLDNLMKANKGRVAGGIVLTGAGLAAGKMGVESLGRVFIKSHKREDGTKVKGFWRKLK